MKTIESYLRGIIVTGVFAIPFLAFIVAGSLFFPFITGKNFGFRMIVEVIFAAWILLAYYNAAYRPKFSWIMAVASLFVVVVFLADLFGFNSYRSFWSNYERMEGFVGLIHVFAYFLVVGSVFTKDLWTKFLHTSVWASITMSFYGVNQLMGGSEISQGGIRLDGRFGNAAYFGGYLLFNIFLTAFLMAQRRSRDLLWYAYAAAIALQTYIMFATETRGSMLGLFVGLVISSLLFIILDKKRPMMKWIAAGTVAFVLAFVMLVFQNQDSDFVKNSRPLARIASISLTENTVASRFMVWGMAIDGFKERPILGWGQENFNIVFNKYYDPGMYAQEQWFDRAHDIFFDWLISAGILGLALYLLLFFFGVALVWSPETISEEKGIWAKVRHAWRSHFGGEDQDKILERSILTGLFASYFVHNIFVFDNLFSYILFFSLLAYLHHHHVRKLAEAKNFIKNPMSEAPLPFSYIGTTVIIVFCGIFYFVNILPIQANTAIIRGISQTSQDGLPTQANLDAFKTAISLDTFGTTEAREQLVQAAMRINSANVSDALKQDFSAYAREQILQQLEDFPNDARYESFAGMLFIRSNMNAEALVHFAKAHELSPKKQTISFNLISAELNAGENDKAVALAKETYELEPKFDDAAITYATTLLRSGKISEGQKLLTERFGTDLVYNENLITAYAANKQFDKIITILQKKLATGEDSQTRLRLAAAFLETGDKANAILEIQKIQAANPNFKEQGDAYINEIRTGKIP
ncbi:MAG: O-antigen ligase family protein [Candidatus Paceibacterota bacterium]|jgi:O-antigen ligase/tetratricopeptide (TPR) repeat protein|nr:O-antigen ligase family protein [Candidatus Paceibacterota bacterium]